MDLRIMPSSCVMRAGTDKEGRTNYYLAVRGMSPSMSAVVVVFFRTGDEASARNFMDEFGLNDLSRSEVALFVRGVMLDDRSSQEEVHIIGRHATRLNPEEMALFKRDMRFRTLFNTITSESRSDRPAEALKNILRAATEYAISSGYSDLPATVFSDSKQIKADSTAAAEAHVKKNIGSRSAGLAVSSEDRKSVEASLDDIPVSGQAGIATPLQDKALDDSDTLSLIPHLKKPEDPTRPAPISWFLASGSPEMPESVRQAERDLQIQEERDLEARAASASSPAMISKTDKVLPVAGPIRTMPKSAVSAPKPDTQKSATVAPTLTASEPDRTEVKAEISTPVAFGKFRRFGSPQVKTGNSVQETDAAAVPSV